MRFLVLNAIHAKKLTQIQGKVDQLEQVVKEVKDKSEEFKVQPEVIEKIERVLADIKGLSKPQMVLSEKDKEFLGQLSLKQHKQEQLRDKIAKSKHRRKSADSYISPDDEIPNKRISIFEQS